MDGLNESLNELRTEAVISDRILGHIMPDTIQIYYLIV